MVTFEMELGKDSLLDSVGPFDKLDRLYLSMYFDVSVVIINVPLINWDFCKGRYFMPLLTDYRMLYGRYRSCWGCHKGLNHPSYEEYAKNTTETVFASACIPKSCPEGQIYHYDSQAEESEQAVCRDPYILSEKEKGVANDNGCHPKFNLDPLGICRNCYKIDIERGSLTPSDCVLFWIRYMDYDFFVYSIGTYTENQLSQRKFVKGETESEKPFYEDLFGEYNWIRLEFEPVILREQKMRRPKDCYRFVESHKDPFGYYMTAIQGYYLQEISTIPGLNATKQIANVEPNSPLVKYYCMRTCKAGEYYDFESTYCRKCDIGCSSCTSFETCDVCIPGWKKIMSPKYSTHKIEYRSQEETKRAEGKRVLKPGMCLQGCQLGFFTVPFSGHCKECNKNCLKCHQKMVNHRYGGEENSIKTTSELFEGYCVECRSHNDLRQTVYTEIPTGRCLESCTARGQFATSIDYEIEQINSAAKKINICVTCHSLRCKKCEINNTAKCLECYEEFYALEKGKCKTFRESTLFFYLILGSIFLGTFLGLLFILIIVSWLVGGNSTEGEKKLKKDPDGNPQDQSKGTKGERPNRIVKQVIPHKTENKPKEQQSGLDQKISFCEEEEGGTHRRLQTDFDEDLIEQEEAEKENEDQKEMSEFDFSVKNQ